MRRLTLTFCVAWLAALAAGGARAQQNVAPPPKPADDGPSLADTMKFIQDKLNGQGPLNYIYYSHDGVHPDARYSSSVEISKVVADPKTCHIAYHSRQLVDGESTDRDGGFDFKDIEKIVVVSAEQVSNDYDAELAAKFGGAASKTKYIPPEFYIHALKTRGEVGGRLFFLDQDLANRVAKAMLHAVELCMPDRKPEPF